MGRTPISDATTVDDSTVQRYIAQGLLRCLNAARARRRGKRPTENDYCAALRRLLLITFDRRAKQTILDMVRDLADSNAALHAEAVAAMYAVLERVQ